MDTRAGALVGDDEAVWRGEALAGAEAYAHMGRREAYYGSENSSQDCLHLDVIISCGTAIYKSLHGSYPEGVLQVS